MPILILCRDLMFTSKILATARARSIATQVIRDPAQLQAQPGTLLLVDLSQESALDAAHQWKSATSGMVIGFTGHMDTQNLQRARELGFDRVLTRGQFTAELDQLLSPEG